MIEVIEVDNSVLELLGKALNAETRNIPIIKLGSSLSKFALHLHQKPRHSMQQLSVTTQNELISI